MNELIQKLQSCDTFFPQYEHYGSGRPNIREITLTLQVDMPDAEDEFALRKYARTVKTSGRIKLMTACKICGGCYNGSGRAHRESKVHKSYIVLEEEYIKSFKDLSLDIEDGRIIDGKPDQTMLRNREDNPI
jgi:hypothetical protein